MEGILRANDQTVKSWMVQSIGKTTLQLKYNKLILLLVEVEAVTNSRPLSYNIIHIIMHVWKIFKMAT